MKFYYFFLLFILGILSLNAMNNRPSNKIYKEVSTRTKKPTPYAQCMVTWQNKKRNTSSVSSNTPHVPSDSMTSDDIFTNESNKDKKARMRPYLRKMTIDNSAQYSREASLSGQPRHILPSTVARVINERGKSIEEQSGMFGEFRPAFSVKNNSFSIDEWLADVSCRMQEKLNYTHLYENLSPHEKTKVDWAIKNNNKLWTKGFLDGKQWASLVKAARPTP